MAAERRADLPLSTSHNVLLWHQRGQLNQQHRANIRVFMGLSFMVVDGETLWEYFCWSYVVKEIKGWWLLLLWVVRDGGRLCPLEMLLEWCSAELSADRSTDLIRSLFIIGHYRYLLQLPSAGRPLKASCSPLTPGWLRPLSPENDSFVVTPDKQRQQIQRDPVQQLCQTSPHVTVLVDSVFQRCGDCWGDVVVQVWLMLHRAWDGAGAAYVRCRISRTLCALAIAQILLRRSVRFYKTKWGENWRCSFFFTTRLPNCGTFPKARGRRAERTR